MFTSIFDLDNPILKFFSRLVDLFVLNAIFIITSLPVFTIGASLTALYYVCITDWDTQNAHIIQKYLHSFKQNFKQSTIIWGIMVLAGLIVGMDAWFVITRWGNNGSNLYRVGVVICVIALLVYLMIFTFVWPLLAKFENTVGKTIQNALAMSVAHLPKTVIAWCLAGVAGYCVYEYLVMKALVFAGVFSVVAFFQSILFRAAFQPYLDEGKRKEGEVWSHETETDRDNSCADAKIEAAALTAQSEEAENIEELVEGNEEAAKPEVELTEENGESAEGNKDAAEEPAEGNEEAEKMAEETELTEESEEEKEA